MPSGLAAAARGPQRRACPRVARCAPRTPWRATCMCTSSRGQLAPSAYEYGKPGTSGASGIRAAHQVPARPAPALTPQTAVAPPVARHPPHHTAASSLRCSPTCPPSRAPSRDPTSRASSAAPPPAPVGSGGQTTRWQDGCRDGCQRSQTTAAVAVVVAERCWLLTASILAAFGMTRFFLACATSRRFSSVAACFCTCRCCSFAQVTVALPSCDPT